MRRSETARAAQRRVVWGALSVLTVTAAACTPERLRPGPPAVTIQVPSGSTVFSPDTLPVRVVASDANGLDSLNITLLDTTVVWNTGFETEVTALVELPVPAGIDPTTMLTIFVRATDVGGEGTTERATVTVIPRPPNARRGSAP